MSFLSVVLRLVGGLVLLIGIYYAVYEGMIEPNKPGHSFSSEDAMQLGSGLIAVIIGLAAVAFGEIIGVLFAIESNTRAIAIK